MEPALWYIKLCHHLQCQCSIWAPVVVPAPPPLTQLPADTPEKTVDNGASVWTPAIDDTGDLDEVPDHWLPAD